MFCAVIAKTAAHVEFKLIRGDPFRSAAASPYETVRMCP